MIPKKLHYVWVGPQPLSDLMRRCMDSWRRILPDYEITEWNEARCANVHTAYTLQALHHRKWAFVSDYVRLYALYHEGGIYLDTDVEVTARLDRFLTHDFFSGYEIFLGKYSPITAVMGSAAGNSIISDLLAYYTHASFDREHGFDQEPNTARISRYFADRFGLQPPYDGRQTTHLDERSAIYPASHFCTPHDDSENYAIHHFNGSWVDGYSRRTKLCLPCGYSVVRFKRNAHAKSLLLPIYDGESVRCSLRFSGKRLLALLKKE